MSTGEVLRRLGDASPPYLTLPSGDAVTVRLWAVGSGAVVTLDRQTWRPAGRRTLDVGPGLGACRTPQGTVALLGAVDPTYDEGLVHGLLRHLAPASWRARLRSPWTGLRLALLDDDLEVVESAEPDRLLTDLPDPDAHGPERLAVDGAGRAVLTTSAGLTVLEPRGLERVAHHPTDHPPTVWAGESRAVHRSGDHELTVVAWD